MAESVIGLKKNTKVRIGKYGRNHETWDSILNNIMDACSLTPYRKDIKNLEGGNEK